MDLEEIELLLTKSEKNLKLEFLALPVISWIVSSGVMLMGMLNLSLETISASLVLTFLSFLTSSWYCSRLREVRSRRVDLFWHHLNETKFGGANAITRNLGQEITVIYQADPRGEVLPLSQAIRLMDTHDKQQQRLEVVADRLVKLRSVQNTLKEKTKQLRGLGESHPEGEIRLQSLEKDEAALNTMREQIQASCHRLGMIAIEAQKTQQMRQLRREISDLTTEKSPIVTSPAFLEPDSLFDIERQITREIETFLQLERDTDRHLREL